jgi:glycolate oxidase FAD binding subunit
MRPASEAELSEIIARRNAPVWVAGGGTRLAAPEGAEVLETSGLSGIHLYEPGALTLVAGAGTPLGTIEAALAAENQRLAFEPPDLGALLGRRGTSTVGGVVATNASGPRRVQNGACRDALIGVRLVDGTGTVIKNGGRVMKNVTGYDLVKLMAGSHGRLGVLTEVAFKLLPAPEQVAVLRLEGLDDAGAVRAMARALGSPYEVTGAAHWPGKGTFLRVEGFEVQVTNRLKGLRALLGGELDNDPNRFAAIRDALPFADQPGDVWRLSVRPSDAPAIVARAAAEAVLYDWGGGLIWLRTAPGIDLRARLGAFDGHATLVRGQPGPGRPRQHPEPPALAALSEGLFRRFDPRGILNPGLMAA